MSNATKRQVFLPLDAVASTLGVPRDWLRREADAGRVPMLETGSRRLFNPDAVADALLQRADEDNTRYGGADNA